jgi:uncharacterized protein (TIGR00369 family)
MELVKSRNARVFKPPQAPDFRSSHGVSGWHFEPDWPYGGVTTQRITQAEYFVNFVPKDAVPRHDGAVQATTGEFAGWWTWTRDNYEVHNGPFWHREENGSVRCVFRVEQKHINGGGAVHGGCLMTFADYCLFAIANPVLEEGRGVTLSFATEFIDAVYKGELVEGTGEVVRAGRSIIFMRGMLTAAGRPVLSFSGTVKRVNAARTTG